MGKPLFMPWLWVRYGYLVCSITRPVIDDSCRGILSVDKIFLNEEYHSMKDKNILYL